jgi:hypothetical protein
MFPTRYDLSNESEWRCPLKRKQENTVKFKWKVIKLDTVYINTSTGSSPHTVFIRPFLKFHCKMCTTKARNWNIVLHLCSPHHITSNECSMLAIFSNPSLDS